MDSPVIGLNQAHVVAVLLHQHFHRPGLLDVDDVLDAFERQRAAAVDVEVGLQLPVPRAREEVVPGGHLLGAGRIQVLRLDVEFSPP